MALRLQDSGIGESETFDSITSLPDDANDTVITILDSIVQPKMDGGKIHKILAELSDGSVGMYYCPGFYGQGASGQVLAFFKKHPGETLQVLATKREVFKNGRQFFTWSFSDVPDDESSANDPAWITPDNTSPDMFTDGYEHDSDSLPGATGGAMASANPATRAKVATKKTSF